MGVLERVTGTGHGSWRTAHPAERGVVPEDLLRVSVGCEHVEDLWADLQQALASTADNVART
jgi:cystathionine beta-lyase/cystathionine gamma-synthase